ncbi:hypothetical protein KP78_16070 [Jeotgalibacillus soli]|uniref:Uncharacterized protein n=1 Tax=Jeotgalibacillus soli TaxID=889306 RepID=A0A0C2RD08_9BACL|nr:hypothetical protein KP78_16070 [Jeotgalibacillus soli]
MFSFAKRDFLLAFLTVERQTSTYIIFFMYSTKKDKIHELFCAL